MKPKPITTVNDLIAQLEQHRDKEIIATWEGIEQEIYLYLADNGTVILDVDGCIYQHDYQIIPCDYCQEPGKYHNNNKSVCCFCGSLLHLKELKDNPSYYKYKLEELVSTTKLTAKEIILKSESM